MALKFRNKIRKVTRIMGAAIVVVLFRKTPPVTYRRARLHRGYTVKVRNYYRAVG